MTGGAYALHRSMAGWTGKHFHTGRNKEVFGAVQFSLHQAATIFDCRSEMGQDGAYGRIAQSGDVGLGRRFATAIIEVRSRLLS